MTETPKITLDNNCIINLLDSSSATATSTDVLSDIIKLALSGKANIAITTRVESDLENDQNNNRRSEMMSNIKIFPVIGTINDGKSTEYFNELQKIIFPGGLNTGSQSYINKKNDIDHLVGHIINKRDIFVTDDGGILKKKEALKTSPGLIVMSPKDCLDYLVQIEEKLKKHILQSDKKVTGYDSPALSGRVTFDYSNNNGYYTIGEGYFLFETKWSSASQDSIHAYSGSGSVETIALAKGVADIGDLKDASIFDDSSHSRTPDEGQIIVLKNKNNIYAAIKVMDVKYDGRGDDKDQLTFEYIIQSDGTPSFEAKNI
ncbi:MAG: hypothetical protein Q7R65_01990 [bacterium]|nr:hypothetical protein [bacterium]